MAELILLREFLLLIRPAKAVLLLARISCDSANTEIAGPRSPTATTETVIYAG